MKNNQTSFLAKRMSVIQKTNTLSINPGSPIQSSTPMSPLAAAA
jgi:hypothetical protein